MIVVWFGIYKGLHRITAELLIVARLLGYKKDRKVDRKSSREAQRVRCLEGVVVVVVMLEWSVLL